MWSVSLQPIIIMRGQAECPSLGGQIGIVVPAQGLAYSYSISMHIWQKRGVFCRNVFSYLKINVYCMYCKQSIAMKTSQRRENTTKGAVRSKSTA